MVKASQVRSTSRSHTQAFSQSLSHFSRHITFQSVKPGRAAHGPQWKCIRGNFCEIFSTSNVASSSRYAVRPKATCHQLFHKTRVSLTLSPSTGGCRHGFTWKELLCIILLIGLVHRSCLVLLTLAMGLIGCLGCAHIDLNAVTIWTQIPCHLQSTAHTHGFGPGNAQNSHHLKGKKRHSLISHVTFVFYAV